jgi:hypothetical protein
MILVEPERPCRHVAEVTVLVSNSSGTGDADTTLVGYTVEVSAGLLYHSRAEAESGVVTDDESRSIGGGTNRTVGFGRLFWAAPDTAQTGRSARPTAMTSFAPCRGAIAPRQHCRTAPPARALRRPCSIG